MRGRIVLLLIGATQAAPLLAQTTPLTRAAVLAMALDRGARLGVAVADTAVANAQLITARALPNPNLSASYSKSLPNYHVIADVPFDLPGVRSLRVHSAQTACCTWSSAGATSGMPARWTCSWRESMRGSRRTSRPRIL